MLVLSRKKNQVIYIEPDIRLVIVSIEGDVVRLGIDAPKNIRIERDDMKSGPKV
jgi:carbon storage regulator